MKSDRLKKVNELIQQTLAERLGELPVKGGLVTVTAVETAPDLRHATVWLSLFGEVGEDELQRITPELRESLSRLELKYIPRLEFKIDPSAAYAEQMERIFRGL